MRPGPFLVHKLPRAQLDLIDIWQHIGDDSPQHADRFLDLIDEKLHMLAAMPGIGRSRSELSPELRSFPVGHYHVFYRAHDDGIAVVRVLHGARDIDALFHDPA